jgi:hypothetical protein
LGGSDGQSDVYGAQDTIECFIGLDLRRGSKHDEITARDQYLGLEDYKDVVTVIGKGPLDVRKSDEIEIRDVVAAG